MIDTQKIETFICAAENLSLTEAAKQLHLSQPAVSHQIKLLEQELGVCLFTRSNTGLRMTEAGHILSVDHESAIAGWRKTTSAKSNNF